MTWWRPVLALALVAVFGACDSTVDVGVQRANASGGRGGAAGGGAGGASGAPSIRACHGHVYQCGDGIDNDGDGLIDAQDPDCLGPCDNTEDSYYGGIPGQNNAPCHEDCYFDQDTGSGNDDCYWSQRCDPLSVAPDYPPSGDSACSYDANATIPGTSATCAQLYAQQSAQCLSYCLPLTPNGCDCFGCCELPAGSHHYVWIGSVNNGLGSCDAAHVNDPTKCLPCTPVPSCFKPCGKCQVCVGKPTLPSSCSSGGTGGSSPQCPTGVEPCGQTGQAPCPANEYCITGCCEPGPA